jgi:hypothetical protein
MGALGAESRVCYPGNTADRQTQWALTYYHLSQSTANQNGKLIHGHRWDSNLRSLARISDHSAKSNPIIMCTYAQTKTEQRLLSTHHPPPTHTHTYTLWVCSYPDKSDRQACPCHTGHAPLYLRVHHLATHTALSNLCIFICNQVSRCANLRTVHATIST